MKPVFSFLLLFLSHFYLQAQNPPESFHVEKQLDMEAILAPKPSLVFGFTSISEARSIINDIMEAVNVQQNFKVVSTTQIDNAAAVMYNNQRYILYNPSFLNQLDNATNDKWASISVIGHEIGHHVLGHTLNGTGSQLPKELAADEFSGLVLKKMGATLAEAQIALRLIGSPYATATHPGESDRLAAIARGWNNTSVLVDKSRDVATNNPYPTQRRNTYPNANTQDQASNDRRTTYPETERRRTYSERPEEVAAGNYPSRRVNVAVPVLVYDIKFRAAANGDQYFITSQNNIVKYSSSRLYTVAKLTATRSADYPFMIYDDQQQLFVNKQGNIVTDKGRNVGYITRHQ